MRIRCSSHDEYAGVNEYTHVLTDASHRVIFPFKSKVQMFLTSRPHLDPSSVFEDSTSLSISKSSANSPKTVRLRLTNHSRLPVDIVSGEMSCSPSTEQTSIFKAYQTSLPLNQPRAKTHYIPHFISAYALRPGYFVPFCYFSLPFKMNESDSDSYRVFQDQLVSPTTSRIYRLRRTSSTPLFTLNVQHSPTSRPVQSSSHVRSHSHRSSGSSEIMAQIFESISPIVSFHRPSTNDK